MQMYKIILLKVSTTSDKNLSGNDTYNFRVILSLFRLCNYFVIISVRKILTQM